MSKMKDKVRSTFENLLEDHQREFEITSKKIRRISFLRIVVFLAMVIGIYLSVNWHLAYLLTIALAGTGGFLFLVYLHGRLFRTRRWLEQLIAINETELHLLMGDTGGLDTGLSFREVDHPFGEDLDIFGERSLFQLINRSATPAGKQKLAGALNKLILEPALLRQRQEAIQELAPLFVWRQNFQATGMLLENQEGSVDDLQEWGLTRNRWTRKAVYQALLAINPLLGTGVILAISLGWLPVTAFLLFLILPFSILGLHWKAINMSYIQLERKGASLTHYSELFHLVETQQFSCHILRDAQQRLSRGTDSAKSAIKELAAISKAFDYRLNLLVGVVLNLFLLWDIRQSIRLEKWKEKYGEEMGGWFEALAHIDEYSSLAGFAFAHPATVYPVIGGQPFSLQVKNVKHPFIRDEKNIGNDVDFTGWEQFQVITGANMAGKSTYLRSVGVNLVLAMTGAPVLADHFLFTPVKIFTGIKTSDSLQDGESYFFAELKRLKMMIERLQGGEKLFVILDEILRGTNSHDKRKGSMALIRQLIRLGASGMIATHDLSLGQLKDDFPEKVRNKCFEVDIHDGELVFDYKLRDGISQNLNASFLMEKMGIVLKPGRK